LPGAARCRHGTKIVLVPSVEGGFRRALDTWGAFAVRYWSITMRPMSARRLTYADAVRILDGRNSPTAALLGRLAGVAAKGATVASAGTVEIFASQEDLIRWGNGIGAALRERVLGLRRFDRTERLVAAHAVLVVTAFFEALDQTMSSSLPSD